MAEGKWQPKNGETVWVYTGEDDMIQSLVWDGEDWQSKLLNAGSIYRTWEEAYDAKAKDTQCSPPDRKYD